MGSGFGLNLMTLPSIGEGRLFNIPRFLFGKLYEPNEPDELNEPYEPLLPFNQLGGCLLAARPHRVDEP